MFEKEALYPLIRKLRNHLVYVGRTLNKGYHLVLRSKALTPSLDNSLFWQGKSRGEFRAKGKYIV
jgi:hypothetical protein